MGVTTLQQVLNPLTLVGLIQDVVRGVPSDLLPKAFVRPNRTVDGVLATYNRVEGTRQLARLVQYGGASKARGQQGISKQPVTLLHTFEHQNHDPTVLVNLLSEDSPTRQDMGRQTVARQVQEFGQLFRNLRMSCVYSVLASGAIYYDDDGYLLPGPTGAFETVDFGVPAGNQGTLDPLGTGHPILNESWSDPTKDLSQQIRELKKAAIKLTGYKLAHAFYGENIPSYFYKNSVIQAAIHGSAVLAEQVARGIEVPAGLMNLQWHPIYEAFYSKADGTLVDWYDPDTIVFTPEPGPEWWEVIEGTYPVPASPSYAADAESAIDNLRQVAGPFSYAKVTDDPAGILHYAGDTFLPVLKVPKAVYIAKVPTA